MSTPAPTTESGPGLYAKAINAAIILVAGVFVTGLADGHMSTAEYIAAGIALLRGVLLFGVRPEWGKVGVYLPLILTAVIATASQLIVALEDNAGISQVELVSLLIVFATAIGSTFATPNAVKSDALRVTPVV
jgi:hypothetical protein